MQELFGGEVRILPRQRPVCDGAIPQYGAVAHINHTIAVIYPGQIVEFGDARKVVSMRRYP